MSSAAEVSGVHNWMEEAWAQLEMLEQERKMYERALETAADPQQRARRWQMLARVEERIAALDERLNAVMNW